MTKEVLTTREAAEWLGLDVLSLRNKIHRKEIPHYKGQNGRVYFKLEELRKFVFAVRVPAASEVASKAEVRSLQ